MGIEKDDYYTLLLRFITYEQINALKRAVEVLRELAVSTVNREILTEGKYLV
jgi:hypothetical protein